MEGKNGRLRHYDGIRRLKATYVIVTGRLATNELPVACQPAVKRPSARVTNGRSVLDQGTKAVGPATGGSRNGSPWPRPAPDTESMERAPYSEPVLELNKVYATAVSLRFLANRSACLHTLPP